jgi:hypothetical protein
MRRILHSCTGCAVLVLAVGSGGSASHAQTPSPAVVATIQIPDADIVGLSVGDNGELAVYDRTPLTNNSLLRFFVASLEDGQIEVKEAPETVTLVGDAPAFKGWMVRDRDNLYALTKNHRSLPGGLSWDQMWVYIISGRTDIAYIGYNDTVDVAGDSPATAPEDFRYRVNGFTLKPANVEGGNNPRLIIDDTIKGNLDILDLNSAGTAMVAQVRHSYRDRYETNCDWPPALPPWNCSSIPGIFGNGLALEWTLDTRASQSDPTLANDDDLYILDPFYSHPILIASHLRRIKLSHPGTDPISAVAQADIDLAAFDSFLTNGVESLHAAPSTDRIWIAAALHDGVHGYVPVFDTLNLDAQVLEPVYSDEHTVLVDPADHNHVIIPVADPFAAPSTLILSELRNGVVVNSVTALTNFDKYSLRAVAFDRNYGLVYLAIDDMLWAVAATEPGMGIFTDGFESGDTSRWSATAP